MQNQNRQLLSIWVSLTLSYSSISLLHRHLHTQSHSLGLNMFSHCFSHSSFLLPAQSRNVDYFTTQRDQKERESVSLLRLIQRNTFSYVLLKTTVKEWNMLKISFLMVLHCQRVIKCRCYGGGHSCISHSQIYIESRKQLWSSNTLGTTVFINVLWKVYFVCCIFYVILSCHCVLHSLHTLYTNLCFHL